MYDVYQIMAGDTIDAIANKFGTNSSVIRQLNPNSGFGVGSMIVVPVTNQYFDIYTIKKGDSLYEIARKYNTDYNLLAMLNGISTNDYIYPDTTILVPKKDVNIDTSIAFAAMSSAFIGGQGDFVTLFEPNALQIEKQGYGYVVASVGELGGVVPYTTYFARNSYLTKNNNLIKGFRNAIQKGLDFVHNSNDEEVAKAIINQFPDTSLKDITDVVKRYRKIEAWPKTTEYKKESFDHLQEIMKNANELDKKVSYDKLKHDIK